MKPVPLAFRGLLCGVIASSLHAQGTVNSPVLTTPGTATWSTQSIAGGDRTVFTITDNTVLDWNQLNLAAGSELVFDFTGGENVVNYLSGTRVHQINGSVTSNGNVSFFAPNAALLIGGSITAKSVTVATMDLDPSAFASGNFTLTDVGGFGRLRLEGTVEATDGDVVLAGRRLDIAPGAGVKASADVLIGAGESVSISDQGPRRLNILGTIGDIANAGSVQGQRAEIAAGSSIENNGQLDVGAGKIYLEVGNNGNISNELNGVIIGDAVFEGANVNDGVIIRPKETDLPPLIGESKLKVPELRSPDGRKVINRQTVSFSAPVSATSDAGRVARTKTRNVAQARNSQPLLKRSSFFGMRGGEKRIASR